MKLAFQGSRSLKEYKEEVSEIIKAEIEKYNPEVVITSGEPDGVCRLTQQYCRRNGITLKLYHSNFKKYARGMWYYRSEAIINDADYIVLIHDGKSKGTQNELDMVIKFNKPYTYHLLRIPKKDIEVEIGLFDLEEGLEGIGMVNLEGGEGDKWAIKEDRLTK